MVKPAQWIGWLTLVATTLLLCANDALCGIIPIDRRIDWSLTGHPGGIPFRTNIAINLATTTNAKYKCVGDGLTDNTAALYSALNDFAGADYVIYLPAGRYRITSRLYFQPWKNRWVLRGDGMGKTVIVCDFPGSSDAFYISSGERPPSENILGIASGYSKGSTNLALAELKPVNGYSTFGPAVGRLMLIDQLNDGKVVTEVGAQGIGQTNRAVTFDIHGEGRRNQSQMVKITGMSSPTNLTFWPPLHISYSSALKPQASIINPNLTTREIGIEDLTFTNKANTHNFVVLNTSESCWIKNVEFAGAVAAPILANDTLFLHVRGTFQNGAKADSDSTYYLQRCHSFRFEDNVFRMGGFIFNGCAGGVVGYNLFTNFPSSGFIISPLTLNHGAHSYMNLFEGNVSSGYFQADYYWGSSGLNTFFRNRIHGVEEGMTANLKCLALDRNSLSNNIVGNVLGSSAVRWAGVDATPSVVYPYEHSYIYRLGYPLMGNNGFGPSTNAADGYDPRVAATALRHGNFDFASLTTKWDPAIPERELPESLYLSDRPVWFTSSNWPVFGSHVSTATNVIPAQLRFSDKIPPPTPSNVQARVTVSNQVYVSWAPVNDNFGAAHYRLERSEGPSGEFVEIVVLNETNYFDSAVVPGSVYLYRLRAADLAGNLSMFSAVVSAGLATQEDTHKAGLVAAWAFDDASGTSALDSGPYSNHGRYTNTTYTPGRFGRARGFNGSNSVVFVPSSHSLNLVSNNMTLEAWIFPTAVLGSWKTILHRETDAWYLHASSLAGPMLPAGGGVFNGSEEFVAGPEPLPTNQWTHLATTYDGATLRLYMNGEQVAARPITGLIESNNKPLRIGGNTYPGQFFQGRIDEVRIYNRALSAAEIQSDMITGITRSSTLNKPASPAVTP